VALSPCGAVVRVDELLRGSREQGLGRVAEQALECGVHTLEVAVEAGDAEQIVGQLEDAVGVALALLAPALQSRRRRPSCR
jgi:hypothetical protein